MTALVHYQVDQDVALITMDSPGNRNALSVAMIQQLLMYLERASTDESIAVLIGSAGRVFCSGVDLAEAARNGMEAGARMLVALQRSMVAHPKPVLVRLSGPVRAAGLGIVASADLAICTDEVTFAFTETRLALAPAAIALTVLPRLTSRAAADTFLTGRTFGAHEAARMGLVTAVVPAAELDGAVENTLSWLRLGHPQGLRETKALLSAPLLAHIDAGAEEAARISASLFGSPAARQVMQAFVSKRRSPSDGTR